MIELAQIDGDSIVIRVPVSALPEAAQVTFDEKYGFEQHDCRITDARKAAEAIVRALNDEDEEGTTPVHTLLDKAVIAAFEEGEEGFDGGEEQ